MADISGPVGSMPGSFHKVPDGMTCDECGSPAVRRVQGETDSFGAEYADYCLACWEKAQKEYAEERECMRHGTCDWCRKSADDLAYTRDTDEGFGGPVYLVCGACRDKQERDDRAELEYMHRDDDLAELNHNPDYDDE